MLALNTLRYPPYASIDKHSGRCRISKKTLDRVAPRGAVTGGLIKVKLRLVHCSPVIVLCSLWPDTKHCLEDGVICIDMTSLVSSVGDEGGYEKFVDWTEAECEVLEVAPYKPISSITYHCPEKVEPVQLLASLPVCVGASVRVHHKKTMLHVTKVNPASSCGVITSSTIMILDDASSRKSSTAAASQTSSHNSPPSSSCTAVVQQLIDRTILPLRLPVSYPPLPHSARIRGVVMAGPPGVGKTYALRAVQELWGRQTGSRDQTEVRILDLLIPDLLSEPSPVPLLRTRLAQAESLAAEGAIVYVLLDEVDALGGQKQTPIQMCLTLAMCDWMDHQAALANGSSRAGEVYVIGTTNRVEDVPAPLRRGGRLEKEISVLSTPSDRSRLIQTMIEEILAGNIEQAAKSEDNGQKRGENHKDEEITRRLGAEFAERTGGYVAADLYAVVREMRDLVSPDNYGDFQAMSMAFSQAMRKIPPSCLRGVSVTSHSKISLDDVVGCTEAKQVLAKVFAAYQPALRERLKRFNLLTPLGGVLLYGPPGNSKTRLVAAAANSFHLPLIALTSADIYSAYLGDAEAEVRKAFNLARQAAPCILFFDEMDSLVANRSDSQTSSAHNVEARVLATFLNEMDGINTHAGNAGVIVMGATNRVDCIDAALLRKGRFYQTVYIAPPSMEERRQLVQYFMERNKVNPDRLEEINGKCWEGMSGAEVENLCKEAALQQINMTLMTEGT